MQHTQQYILTGTKETKQGVKIVTVSLTITGILCLFMVTALTDGECHNNRNQYGCIPNFHAINIYLAMIMIVIDAVLFAVFCYKWFRVMHIFKMSENDNKIPIKIVQSFIIQFTLTIIAMISCLFDGIMHLILHYEDGSNYHITMIIFLFDCTLIASCNFCMISESQAIIRKFICFCCQKYSVYPITGNTLNKPTIHSIAYLSNNVSAQSHDSRVGVRGRVHSDDPTTTRSRTNSVNTIPSSKNSIIITPEVVENIEDIGTPKLDTKVTDFKEENELHPPLSMEPTNEFPNSKQNLDVINEEIKDSEHTGDVIIIYKKEGTDKTEAVVLTE